MSESGVWAFPEATGEQRDWPGMLGDPTLVKEGPGQQVAAVADAARAGQWERVFTLLDEGSWSPNVWRPGGTSRFTPLHQAAWHGASDAARELVRRGAWLSLKNAHTSIAAEVAAEHGHHDLAAELAPPRLPAHLEPAKGLFTALDHWLAELIVSRTRQLRVQLAMPQSQVLTECPPGTRLWCAVPGMYGGFSIELRGGYLYVTSWSRVAGGSGQAHVVTTQGYTLVEEGFV